MIDTSEQTWADETQVKVDDLQKQIRVLMSAIAAAKSNCIHVFQNGVTAWEHHHSINPYTGEEHHDDCFAICIGCRVIKSLH